LSNRSINEIWIIDHSTTTEQAATHSGGISDKGGDLLYRWGNPIAYQAGIENDQKIFRQHDAHWIANGLEGEGNILIFSNGLLGPEYSSIEEIISPIDANDGYPLTIGSAYGPTNSVWSYSTTPTSDFYSPRYGGSQRLPNGNTLICNSEQGEFFEVDQNNEIIWRYINPVIGDTLIAQDAPLRDGDGNWIYSNFVFRCYKYAEDYPGFDGKELISGNPLKVNNESNNISNFKLYDNYPNPFNPITNIEFSLDEGSFVTITIYDLVGNQIRTLANKFMEAGLNNITWDSRDENGNLISSGLYFYNLNIGLKKQTKKMVLVR